MEDNLVHKGRELEVEKRERKSGVGEVWHSQGGHVLLSQQHCRLSCLVADKSIGSSTLKPCACLLACVMLLLGVPCSSGGGDGRL